MCRNIRHSHHETSSSCSFPLRRRLVEVCSSISFLMATCSARALRQPTHLLGSSSWSPTLATAPLRFGSFAPVLRRYETTLDRRDYARGSQGVGVLFGVWMKANNRKSKKKTGRSGDGGEAGVCVRAYLLVARSVRAVCGSSAAYVTGLINIDA